MSLLSCVSSEARDRHPLQRSDLWHRYRELPEARALAIAGDPEAVWVGGVAAGVATRVEAEKEAIAECMRHRAARRMQQPCVLYAVGGEVQRQNFRRRRTWP